ncbi:hypothetical protein [Chryseobacterium sp. 2VB]|uniref:hypothetical protein n=1 Tax=Chryseobacterium sp. 2VB TaxID=2502204 RepID=UPI0010F5890B|nr:hypothetical protein [Chryseobacterium sp. 2VB]
MIAPQELRLGNWININGSPFQIELPDFNLIVNKNGKSTYEPIELNEDWLLKLGYERDKNEYCVSGHDRFNVFQSVKGPYIFCDDEKSIRYVRYVHELQNLFFALTGEELKIKES